MNNSNATRQELIQNRIQTRTEKDSLGDVQLPYDALYGAQTQRALENFPISGRSIHPELIRAYLRLKLAAAVSNETSGALSPEISLLIQNAARDLLSMPTASWKDIFPVDSHQAGAGTSSNMNVNEVIANLANLIAGNALGSYKPVHPNDHVNRSQSTNDTFPTAMRMALVEASRELWRELEKLSAAFGAKARAWMHIPKSGRTHLQDAVPMMLGQEFAAYSLTVSRCARWIELARKELMELGIGGSAAGTGLTVPEGYAEKMISEISRLTGESFRLSPNLVEAMQSQSPVAYYSSMLRLMALELTRICNDLRLLASGPMTGFAEIILPSVQPGSSIMPGKVNPSIIEMANQSWFAVLGEDQTVAYATQSGQLELNVMMPIMAQSLLEATGVATAALKTLRERAIEGMKPNEEKLRKYYESTPQVATALSPRLGYAQTAELVKEALSQGTSVLELIRSRGLVPEDELRALTDPHKLTGT
jgi:aspartate ammonia-lyase